MKYLVSIILIVAGSLRLGDLLTDVMYLATEPFYSDLFFYLCLTFIILPSVPNLILVTCVEVVAADNNTNIGKFNAKLAILMSFGEQFGLYSIIFGVFYIFKPIGAEKPYLLYMTRYTAVLHSLLESMPMAVIQIINCANLLRFPKILIISCIFSGLSISFTIIRVVYLFDRVAKVEKTIELQNSIKYLEREAWRNTSFTLEYLK